MVVANGMSNANRYLSTDIFAKSAVTMIASLAEAYSGADITKESNRKVFQECARLLRRQFPELSVEECSEAFSLAAASHIDADLTAYKGVFTVAMFGDVLAAYKHWRKNIVAQLSKCDDDLKLAEIEEQNRQKSEAYHRHVISEFKRLQLKNTQFDSAEKIPIGWAKRLNEEGLIESNPETWIQAKKAVCDEFVNKVSGGDCDLTIGSLRACRDMMRKINSDPEYFPEELRSRAEILYGRRLVFQNISTFTSQ